MTIQFKGHVSKVEANGPQIAVTVQTPMAEANGAALTLNLPASEATHWLAGSPVQFTIYALPRDASPTSTDRAPAE